MPRFVNGIRTSRLQERTSERKLGYFFVVNWDHPDPKVHLDEGTHAKCVFDPKRRLEVRVIGYDKPPPQLRNAQCGDYPDLPHHTKHSLSNLDNVVVAWDSSDPDDFDAPDHSLRDGLVYCNETAYHFIGRPLLETMQKKGLTGLRVSQVSQEKDEYGPTWLADDEIVMIDGVCSPYSRWELLPEESNVCEYCGYSPILCPVCGMSKLNRRDFSSICPKCDRVWLLGPDAPESEKKKMRIQVADPLPEPCVDLAEWDGSDFNTGMLVTRRVVELLERLKCGSFRAEPVAVDVTGLTDEQWKLLEASRQPC